MFKKTIVVTFVTVLATISAATVAYAALPGFNAGLQLGAGDIHYPSSINGTNGTNNKTSFAGRVYIGYLFNQYVGAELAYSGFAKSNVTFNQGISRNIQRNAVDLLVKGIAPINEVNLFAKAGIAYVGDAGSDKKNYLLPAFGVGIGYDINQNVALDVSWLRYQHVKNTIASSDLFSLGVNYSFG